MQAEQVGGETASFRGSPYHTERQCCFNQTSMRMPAIFDGSFQVGEDPQQKVLIFTNQMNALLGKRRCLEAVESPTPITAGQPNVDRVVLETEFGAELADRVYRAWRILINTIMYKPLLLQIQALESSSEGGNFFNKFHAPQSAAAKAKITQAWYSFGMKDGEAPNANFARGSVLRSQLGTDRFIHTENNVNQNFARNLISDYSVQKSILLAKEELSRKVLEDVVLNAYGEMEMAKEKGMRDGKGQALFLADLGGRGNGGGGIGGRGGRGRSKLNEGRGGQQQHHQQQQYQQRQYPQ